MPVGINVNVINAETVENVLRNITSQRKMPDAGLCLIYFDSAPFQRNWWRFTGVTGAFYEKRRPDARVTFTVPLERRVGFVQEVGVR